MKSCDYVKVVSGQPYIGHVGLVVAWNDDRSSVLVEFPDCLLFVPVCDLEVIGNFFDVVPQ